MRRKTTVPNMTKLTDNGKSDNLLKTLFPIDESQ